MKRSPVAQKNQMDLLGDEKMQWLSSARIAAQKIAFEDGSVTAEDIRRACPIPGWINKNVMGKLFADRKTFVWNGVKKSSTASRKGGLISVWMLTEEARLHWTSHYTRKAG